jgi:glycine cleavage system regulatory protein
MSFATKIYQAFKDEPQKAEILFEFAEFVEKSHGNLQNLSTKDDLELAKKQLEFQIKQLEANTNLKLKELEGKIETTKKELELKIEQTRSSLLRWSFLFWISQMATLIGILYAILK